MCRRLITSISRIAFPSLPPDFAERTPPLLTLALALILLAACSTTTDPTPSSPTATAPPSPTNRPTATPISAATPTSPAVPDGLTSALVTRVVDGDTIDVQIDGADYRLRYIGIDTPETVHPSRPVECYGREASDRNREFVEGQTVGLEKDVSETDQFGRLLRYVWLGDLMVNAALVRDGYALASTYPPDVKHADLFASLQAEAREAGRGLWGTVCTSPTPVYAPGECEYSGTSQPIIKGNISQSTGEKIYHVPGGEFYDATIIDESAGEMWFCTEEDALAAGWRKSLR